MSEDHGADPLRQRVAAEELDVGAADTGGEHLAEAAWLPCEEFDRRDGGVAVTVTDQSTYRH
jgi:hypothetical protein